jgi:hypothetical protein
LWAIFASIFLKKKKKKKKELDKKKRRHMPQRNINIQI